VGVIIDNRIEGHRRPVRDFRQKLAGGLLIGIVFEQSEHAAFRGAGISGFILGLWTAIADAGATPRV